MAAFGVRRAHVGRRNDKERIRVVFGQKRGEFQGKFFLAADLLRERMAIIGNGDSAAAPYIVRPNAAQAADAVARREKIGEVHGLADIFFVRPVFFFVQAGVGRGGFMRQQRDSPVCGGLIDNDGRGRGVGCSRRRRGGEIPPAADECRMQDFDVGKGEMRHACVSGRATAIPHLSRMGSKPSASLVNV